MVFIFLAYFTLYNVAQRILCLKPSALEDTDLA